MGAAEHAEQDRLDASSGTASSGTLGDLLYADKSKTPVSENDWIRLVQSVAVGDQLALHALYERAHRVVFTLIMRITGNRETAEELTVDVFYDVWRRASRYDAGNGSVLGWILNQARSRAIDRLRFEQRKKRVDPHASDSAVALESGVPAIETTDCHAALAFKEQSRALRSALTALTPGEREAIEAAFFSELTHTEVAARLNQPIGTVKTRIRSGLHKLRRALAVEAEKP
jgi:RNA polymerase sigma-70 factor (ECF subfamily)